MLSGPSTHQFVTSRGAFVALGNRGDLLVGERAPPHTDIFELAEQKTLPWGQGPNEERRVRLRYPPRSRNGRLQSAVDVQLDLFAVVGTGKMSPNVFWRDRTIGVGVLPRLEFHQHPDSALVEVKREQTPGIAAAKKHLRCMLLAGLDPNGQGEGFQVKNIRLVDFCVGGHTVERNTSRGPVRGRLGGNRPKDGQ